MNKEIVEIELQGLRLTFSYRRMNNLAGPIKQSLGGTALLAGVTLLGIGINASLFNGTLKRVTN